MSKREDNVDNTNDTDNTDDIVNCINQSISVANDSESHDTYDDDTKCVDSTINTAIDIIKDYQRIKADVSKPTDQDIQHFEDSIVLTVGKKTHEKTKTETKKMKIIHDIIDLSHKTGIEVQEEKKLKRLTIPELERLMAKLLEKGVNDVSGIPSDEQMIDEFASEEEKEKIKEMKQFNRDIDIKFGASTLYTLNVFLAKCSEEYVRNKTDSNIDGYADGVRGNKDELIHYYSLIYQEHGEILSKYLTPVTQVILMNGALIFNAYSSNSGKSLNDNIDIPIEDPKKQPELPKQNPSDIDNSSQKKKDALLQLLKNQKK